MLLEKKPEIRRNTKNRLDIERNYAIKIGDFGIWHLNIDCNVRKINTIKLMSWKQELQEKQSSTPVTIPHLNASAENIHS